MKIRLNDSTDATEIVSIANRFKNCDIDAQFGRLGQQWVTTAGASTGAWLGLCICVLITVGVLVYQKKKGSNQVTE